MKHLNRLMIISVILLAALLVSACQPIVLQPAPSVPAGAPAAEVAAPVEPPGPRPDAPPYALRGPYAVGARDFVIQDGDEPVYITVWYPALNPTNVKEEITYDLSDGNTSLYEIPATTITDLSIVTVNGHAIRDAAPNIADGPYPLVVFSEGLTAWRHWHAYLLEHLASHGFVVIAGDPREVFESFWTGAATRPLDTKSIIAYADTLTADGELADLIDTEQIAVTGHSSGGWTALAGGGAQFDFGWCAANPDFVAENPISNCNQFVPHQEEIAAMLGLEAVPEGLWPPVYDPRVDAVVALAADGDIWGADFGGVANVEVPTLLMVGTQDHFANTFAQSIYEHLGSTEKSLMVFENADHMIFITQCEDLPWIVDTSGYWFCADAVWDMDRAHDLIKHFTTAFLLAELKGDAEAAAALAPENVTFPGITYETTAYARVTEPTAALDEVTIEKIEALVETTMRENQIPGFALGIVKDGELVYAKGFGVAELGQEEPITPQSLFHLASIGKTVVGTAVVQLAEQGKIDLDAPVTDYLPYFQLADERYNEMTIRQFLSHTSGMPDVEDYEWDNPVYDDEAAERYVRSLSDVMLLTPPGEAFAYSSLAYDVLGDVIAKASGQSFEGYVQEHIFTPLGMEHTTFLMPEADAELLAAPHVRNDAGDAVVSDVYPYNRMHAPSSTLKSNVEDMARYAMAHMNHGELEGARILDPASYDELWAEQAVTGWEEWGGPMLAHYGLGWFIGDLAGHPVYHHLGADDGFNANFAIAPDDSVAVIAMLNLMDWDEDVFHVSTIAEPVMEMLLGIEAEEIDDD